jgi:soluble lytic murein transglycosylase
LKRVLSFSLIFAISFSAPAANLSVVSISFDQNIEAPRWMFDSKAKPKGGPLILAMVSAKRDQQNKDRAACLTHLEQAYKLGKSLGPWIVYNQLTCAQMKDKKGAIAVAALNQAVARLEAQPRWLLFGPQVASLRAAYTGALLALAEVQGKSDRKSAWKTLDKLQQVRSWLSVDEKASAYRYAGELAFIEQNLAAAQDFMMRSLSQKESAELRGRVESIRSSLLGKKDAAPDTAGAPEAVNPAQDDLGISDEERDIFGRMSRAYDSQDYVSAIEDGIELIQKYPGSRRSLEATDKILDIYLTLSNKTDEKFRHVRESIVKEMEKADGGRLNRWAQNAFARGNYLDALNLAEKSYEKLNGHPDSTKVLLLAGKAAVAAGEYTDAQTHFEKLIRQHGGTPEAAEGAFRMGLLDFRRKRYPQAAAYFERLLALKSGKDFEYRALYWQWRAQQKIDLEKSAAFADTLIKKYPLSYYGLRAKAETTNNSIQLPNKTVAVKADLRLLESERLAWERLGILLKAGWFKEAEKELEALPDPQSNEERILRAKYWAAALRYDMAMGQLNQVIEENPDFLQAPILRVIFPDEYLPWVGKEAKSANVPAEWILSLIRQESSFRPDVKSPSNAIGVMQLMPATAAELAKEFKLKDYGADSLLNPDVNIKIGSVYFSRLIKSFGGNIPLALAAYNAGPGRLKRWLGARKDVTPPLSSSPEVEVWMDELPWDETSFYVKAILRNWLIYRLLDGSKLSLSEPIWVDAKATAR